MVQLLSRGRRHQGDTGLEGTPPVSRALLVVLAEAARDHEPERAGLGEPSARPGLKGASYRALLGDQPSWARPCSDQRRKCPHREQRHHAALGAPLS
ncbi:hypothetical protein L7F22_009970 [Adiantum nelumboides]|nr:hypothetical protein [Adiantum nelumboides]